MEAFIDNLKDLIFKSGLSLRELSKESGVSAMQFSRYLRGFIPTVGVTLKIAKYFDCSLDFLFGLTDVQNSKKYKTHDKDMSKFIDRYFQLLDKNNISHYKFIKDSNFDESILRHWKAGSTPRLDVIYFIAKNLNGSIDYLIGRH